MLVKLKFDRTLVTTLNVCFFVEILLLLVVPFQYEIGPFVLPAFFVTRQMAFPGRKLPLRATYLKVCEYLFRDLFLKKGESVPEVIQD